MILQLIFLCTFADGHAIKNRLFHTLSTMSRFPGDVLGRINNKLFSNIAVNKSQKPQPELSDSVMYRNRNIYPLLNNALMKFYFFREEFGEAEYKMNAIINSMKKEVFSPGTEIIAEGEPGNKLYVVEAGDLHVSICGEYIRTVSRGDMLGELALLYDAPRSATVTCATTCILWTLEAEEFKRIESSFIFD